MTVKTLLLSTCYIRLRFRFHVHNFKSFKYCRFVLRTIFCLFLPFKRLTELSLLIATIRLSQVPLPFIRARKCPLCRISKTPLANPIQLPRVPSRNHAATISLAFGNEQILDFSSSPTIDLERSHCSISCADS